MIGSKDALVGSHVASTGTPVGGYQEFLVGFLLVA